MPTISRAGHAPQQLVLWQIGFSQSKLVIKFGRASLLSNESSIWTVRVRTLDLMTVRKLIEFLTFRRLPYFPGPYTNSGRLLSLKAELLYFQLDRFLEQFWHSTQVTPRVEKPSRLSFLLA